MLRGPRLSVLAQARPSNSKFDNAGNLRIFGAEKWSQITRRFSHHCDLSLQ